MKSLLYFLIISCLISCSEISDKDIFNGEIKTVADTVKTTVKLEPQDVVLDGITYGLLTVYDSLAIFYNNKLPDRFYSIFNLNTGKHTGDFCPKGHGPGEMTVVSPIFQLYKENGDLKALLSASQNLKLVIWNISKSVENNKTVWDFIVYDRRRDGIEHNYFVRLNDREYLAGVQTDCTNDDCTQSNVPYLEKRTIDSDTLIREYRAFKQCIKHEYSDRLLMTHKCVKPDGSKLIQFMCYMWQVNMTDLETGKITGFRPQEKYPDFSYLSAFSEPRGNLPGFVRATSTGKYIFAVFREWTHSADAVHYENADYTVYVFDWDCNLIRKIKLENEFYNSISVDEVNNFLYTLNEHEDGETIRRYDLKSIGL
jgi:hypothetical protein